MIYLYLFILISTCILVIWKQCTLSTTDKLAIEEWSDSNLVLYQAPYSSWSTWTNKYPEIYRKKATKRKQHGYFLHITDMHVDEDYVEGGTVNSACHRLSTNIEKNSRNKPIILGGKYGAPGESCDAPIKLAQETLDWISKEWKDKLDFVVWTGDNSKHDWDKKIKRKRGDVYDLNKRVTRLVMDTFWMSDRIPVIPSFGNNDVYPHNQIAGPDVDGDLLTFYEKLFRPWIPDDQRSTFRKGGYYITQVAPKLKVLTLNSMYFYKKNKSVKSCLHPKSPGAIQLSWFLEQLKQARKNNEKIYVIGHVPPSPRDYKEACLTDYLRIAIDYADVIMGQFFAHLNMDHFLLFDGKDASSSIQAFNIEEDDHLFHATRNVKAYMQWLRDMYNEVDPSNDKNAPVNSHPPLTVIQVAPSILPVYHPSFRIYHYETTPDDEEDDIKIKYTPQDDDDVKPYGTLLGYSQYFANLTYWNSIDADKSLEYKLEYNTNDTYGMEDLTVESYFELAKSMLEDTKEGRKLWNTYKNHMLVKTKNF